MRTKNKNAIAAAQAEVAQAKDLLTSAEAKMDTLLANGGAALADSIVPDSDERYPRGTAIWLRRASKSDDRIPAVIVRHSKGWTMCGRPELFTWADLQAEFFNEPLTWFSVVAPDQAMGDNLI